MSEGTTKPKGIGDRSRGVILILLYVACPKGRLSRKALETTVFLRDIVEAVVVSEGTTKPKGIGDTVVPRTSYIAD